MALISEDTKRKVSKNCNEDFSDSSKNCPRESMKKNFPICVQPFFTALTGKPYCGEKEPSHTKLTNYVVQKFLILGAGIAISTFVAPPIGWVFILHGSRWLRLTGMHASSHFAVSKVHKYNEWLGEAISILTLTGDFNTYQREHTKTHHSKKLLTPSDETYEYLMNVVSFKRGITEEQAQRHFLLTLFSPKFHFLRFKSRLSATFFSKSRTHNLFCWTFWLTVLTLVTLTNSWLIFLSAWIFPISILFEMSSLCRQVVEHEFPGTDERNPEILNMMTKAIFCGENTPQLDSSSSIIKRFSAWTIWVMRMIFYHLMVRVLILTGDSAGSHDWHHRHPGSKEWLYGHFKRAKEIENGARYYHYWGLIEAMKGFFRSLQ